MRDAASATATGSPPATTLEGSTTTAWELDHLQMNNMVMMQPSASVLDDDHWDSSGDNGGDINRHLATLNVDGDGSDNNNNNTATTTTTTQESEEEEQEFKDDDFDLSSSNTFQTPTPVVTLLHNAPRGLTFRGHTNRLATIVSSTTQEQFQYVGGLKYFCVMFVVVPFAIWTACLLILKCVYTPSRVGCAAGGQHLDMKQLSKQGVSRKQRKVRILRSYRLQSTFMIVAVLIPIITTVMMMKGYKPFVDESLPQIQSLVDDVETLTYRGWNAVTGIKSASKQLLNDNDLIQEILNVDNQQQQQQQDQSRWCDTSTLVDTDATIDSNSNTTQSQQFQDAVRVFSSTMSTIEEHTSDMVRLVENYLLSPSNGGLLPTDETFQVVTSTTQSIDESIDWFLMNDWIFKFVVMVLNVVVILLAASVYFQTKNNYYHEPTRAYNSYVLIPLLCISAITLLVMTCTIGVSALINGDFCSGGGSAFDSIHMTVDVSQHDSPQATFQDVIMMVQYGTLDRSVRSQQQDDRTTTTSSNASEIPLPLLDLSSTSSTNITVMTTYDNVYDLLWDAINYYSNQCLDESQNPFLFLDIVQEELESAIAQTNVLSSLIDPSATSSSPDDDVDVPLQDPSTSDNSSSTTPDADSFYFGGGGGGGGGDGSTLDGNDQNPELLVQLLNEVCGGTTTDGVVDSDFVDFLPAAIEDLRDELMELKGQLSLLIDDTLSCHQISPVFRLLQRGALCTTSPHGLAVTWICSFCICVLCFVLLSVRAALFNTIQKKKLRPHKPRHVVEKEFGEYQQFMKQFYDDDEVMNGWFLDEPLPTPENCKSKAKLFDFEKTASDEDGHGGIPLNPTMETEPEIFEDDDEKFDFTAVMDMNELHVPNPTLDDEILQSGSVGQVLQHDGLINDEVDEAEENDIDDDDDDADDDSSCGSSYDSVVSDDENDNDSCDEIEDEQSAMVSFISETRSVAMLTAISVQSALKPFLNAVRLRKTVRSTPSSASPPLSPSKFTIGGQSFLDDDDYPRSILDDFVAEQHPEDTAREEESGIAKNPSLLTSAYASDDISVSSCTPVPQKVVSSKRLAGAGNENSSNPKRIPKQNSGIFLPKTGSGRMHDRHDQKKPNRGSVSTNEDVIIDDDLEDYEPSLNYIMPSYHRQKTKKKALLNSKKHHRESKRDPKSSPVRRGTGNRDTTAHRVVDVILRTPGSVVSALTPDRPIKGFSFLSRTDHHHGTDAVDDSVDMMDGLLSTRGLHELHNQHDRSNPRNDSKGNSIRISHAFIPSTPPPSNSTVEEEERSPLVIRLSKQEHRISRKAPPDVTNPKRTDDEVERKTSTGDQVGNSSKRIVLGESVRHKVRDNPTRSSRPSRKNTDDRANDGVVVAEIESTPIITPAKTSKESTTTGMGRGDVTANDDLVLPPDPPKPRKSVRSFGRLKFMDDLEGSLDKT